MANGGASDRLWDFCSPSLALCCSPVCLQHLQSNQITDVMWKEASKWATLGLRCPCPWWSHSSVSFTLRGVGEGVVMSPARWMWEKTAHTNESLAPGNLRRTLVHEGRPTAAIPSNVWFAKRHLSWSLKYRNPINAASRRSPGRKAAAHWSQLPRKARKQGWGGKDVGEEDRSIL